MELIDRIYEDIQKRKSWDDKQRRWYKMRFDGLGRLQKPYPTASDLHFAVSDKIITDFRPYYIEQLYSSETFGRFIPNKKDFSQENAVTAGQYFSYQLKENSNFDDEIRIAIDKHLMQDLCPFKIRFDYNAGKLDFEAIDPIDLIVPPYTRDIQDADYVCHVLEVPKHIYLENASYNQNEDFVKRASGEINPDDSSTDMKAVREGLQEYSKNNKVILLWEIYRKVKKKVYVSTWSPFIKDEPVKKEMRLLYNHQLYPFEVLCFEKTDRGYYSSRGITQIVAPHEDVATKIWNNQMDRFDFTNRPVFTGTNPMPNSTNVSFRPGAYLSGGVSCIEFPASPWDYNTEMNVQQQRASDRVGSPQAGIMDRNEPVMNPRTKFQMSQIGNINSTKIGDRGRLFARFRGKVYRQAWALIVQFKDKLASEFYFDNNYKQVSEEIFTDNYTIQPSMSADGLTKEMQLQKAMTRMQMFIQNPYINQSELIKSILELDDPTLIKRLYIDPKVTEQDQVKRQLDEIVLMRNGFPVQLNADDIDEVHLNTIIQVMAQQWGQGQAARQALQMYEPHLMDHLERLRQQKNDVIYNTYREKINQFINHDEQIQREVAAGAQGMTNGRANVQMAA